MIRAVIPMRCLGDEPLPKQALALLLAAIASGVLKHDVHGILPKIQGVMEIDPTFI